MAIRFCQSPWRSSSCPAPCALRRRVERSQVQEDDEWRRRVTPRARGGEQVCSDRSPPRPRPPTGPARRPPALSGAAAPRAGRRRASPASCRGTRGRSCSRAPPGRAARPDVGQSTSQQYTTIAAPRSATAAVMTWNRPSPSGWLPVPIGTFGPRPSGSIRSSRVRVRGAGPAPAHLARPPGTYTFDEYYDKKPSSSEAS
jgi:hypothetical protein